MLISVPAPQLMGFPVETVHAEDHGAREIVDMEEFSQRRSSSPDDNRRVSALLGLMEFSQQRRKHVTGLGVEIVVGSIEIARHDRNVAPAELALIGLAHLDAGDFRDRIPFVGRLERPGEQAFLGDRLRSKFGVDAGRAEKHQPVDAGHMRAMD